jgi:hypothetical protein
MLAYHGRCIVLLCSCDRLEREREMKGDGNMEV